MFYVSGGGTADIYKVDRSGAIVETLTDLRPFRLEDGGHALPKGLVLAPASNSEGRSLWVGDYGRDQVADGRLFEIRLEDSPVAVASASQTAAYEALSLLGWVRSDPATGAHCLGADMPRNGARRGGVWGKSG